MNRILLLFTFLFLFKLSFAQVPANDNCVAPQVIVIPASGNICVNSSNINATSDNTTNACDTGPAGDEVWFAYTVTGTQNTITVSPTGSPAAQQLVVTIQNTNCASGVYLTCGSSITNGGSATASYAFAPGTQILISVETNGANGNFQLCITSTTPPPTPGTSCATSNSICNLNNFTLNTMPPPGPGISPPCFGGAFTQQAVFYQFTVGQTGTCAWLATPLAATEYDWAMYNITAGCPGNIVACNYHFAGTVGAPVGMQVGNLTNCGAPIPALGAITREICPAITVTAGQTYLIVIDNYSHFQNPANNTGFNFSWAGSTFQLAPTAAFTVNPTSGCNSVLASFNNTTVGATTQNWNFGDNTTFVGANPPSHNYSSPGTYLISLAATSATGCTSTAAGNVTVNPTPTVVAPANITVCSGVSVPINNIIPNPNTANVNWTNSNTNIGLAANGTFNIPSFTATNNSANPISGVVTISTSLNGCIGNTVTYTITVNPNVTNSLAGANQVGCASNATLSGNTPTNGTGTWTLLSGTGNVTSPNSGSTGVTGLTVGTNVFQWSISNGLCPASTSTVSITVNAVPTIANAGPNQFICGTTATMAANTPLVGNGIWTLLSGTGLITTPNSPTTGITGLGLGPNIFRWTISNPPCTPSASQVTLTGVVPPTVTVPSNFTICAGATTLASNFTSPSAGSSFDWTNSDPSIGLAAIGTGNVPAFTAINNTNAPINAVITVTPTTAPPTSCSGIANTYTITVNPGSTATINSATICNGQAATLTAVPAVSGGIFSWAAGGQNTQSITVSPTATTSYTLTYTIGGCPSTTTATVTVNSVPTVSVNNATICAGQNATLTASPSVAGGTYLWLASSQTTQSIIESPATTATYSVTYTLNSCSTIGSGSITVNQIPSVSANNATVCAGQSTLLTATPSVAGGSYLWSPGGQVTQTISVTPASTTTYSVTYTLLGCPVTNTVAVSVNTVPTVTVNSATICFGQNATLTATPSIFGGTYLWSAGAQTNQNITESPTTTTTYSVSYSLLGCSSNASGQISVNQIPTVLANAATICAGQSATLTATPSVTGGLYAWLPGGQTTQTISVTPASTTTYSVAYSLNGCPTGNTTTVTVNSVPTVSVNSTTICSGQTSTLTATPSASGGSFLWSVGAQVTQSINVSPNATTTYSVNYTLNGCSTTGTGVVFINNLATLSIPSATICAGQNATLTATPSVTGGTFLWAPGGEQTQSITVSPATNSTYTVTYTVLTCPIVASVAVTVNPVPTVTVSSTTVCAGQAASITATPSILGGTYSWTGTTQTSQTITISPTSGTTYSVTYTLAGCTDQSSGVVTVTPLPIVIIAPSPIICVGETATITATPQQTGGTFLWLPSGQTTSSISQTPSSSTTYTVTYLLNGCNGKATGSITVQPKPIAAFSVPSFVSINNPVVYFNNNSQGANSWNWYFGDLVNPTNDTSTAQNPAHTYSQVGYYCVNLVVSNGLVNCIDTAEVCFNIESEYTFFIPNAFTPNLDILNDGFSGKGQCIDEYQMSIFDRWGNKIFQTDELAIQWDGRVNGSTEIAQQDVYVYVINIKDKFGEKHKYIGNITLIR
jgi:gliding motility-associated-like protein